MNEELARSDTIGLPAPAPSAEPSELATPRSLQGELEFAAPALASERQLEFLYQLARQIRGLGGQRLMLVAEHRYGRSLNELTAAEASSLIDVLKEVRAGAGRLRTSFWTPPLKARCLKRTASRFRRAAADSFFSQPQGGFVLMFVVLASCALLTAVLALAAGRNAAATSAGGFVNQDPF